MKPISIFVADDHQLILEGLSSLISGIEQFQLTGKASNGKDVISQLTSTELLPDICILDIEMPEMDGVATLKVLKEKFPSIKVLMLTMRDEPFYINRVIKEGADGYILKNLNRDTLIKCVRMIIEGEPFFTNGFSTKNSRIKNTTDKGLESLTEREKLILKLIALGKSNKEIAAELFISKRTVDTHRNNLKKKLQLPSVVHLVHFSFANGLV